MAFLDKNTIFRPHIELEAMAIQSVEASREVICASFGNIGRNSWYFLLPIFLGSHPNGHTVEDKTEHQSYYSHLSLISDGWFTTEFG